MILNESRGSIFDLNDRIYFFAHCISSDFALSKGIAVEFENKYNLKQKLLPFKTGRVPDVIIIDNIFNLVTKEKYWNKPNYYTIQQCIISMRDICIEYDIKYLAIPKLGCGLDRLNWEKVKSIIKEEFKNIDITIEVRYL